MKVIVRLLAVLLAVLVIASCQGTSAVGCPAGSHAVPAPGGFACKKY